MVQVWTSSKRRVSGQLLHQPIVNVSTVAIIYKSLKTDNQRLYRKQDLKIYINFSGYFKLLKGVLQALALLKLRMLMLLEGDSPQPTARNRK